MIGILTTLKLSALAQSSRKYSSKARTSMREKSGPLESDPAEVVLGNNTKMFPTVGVMIFVNLDMDAELDKVPKIASFPSSFFL